MATRAEVKEQTRAAIAEATRSLIAERGFRDATIEQIADRAGISPRTFFRHFPSKEAALLEKAEQIQQAMRSGLDERPADEPVLASIRAVLSSIARRLQGEREWMLQMTEIGNDVEAVQAHLDVQASYVMRDIVMRWAERRLGVPAIVDPRPGVIAGVTVTCIDTARRRWLAHSGTLDLAELVGESLDALADLVSE